MSQESRVDLPIDQVIHGDCLSVMRGLPDCSIDAIITDPPCGINFMNMAFDSDRGGRDQWIAWLTEIMVEAKRVLKPGGHALVWSLPRTSHWTATALEDAGWEVRDCVSHLYSPNAELTKFMESLSQEQQDALYRIVQSQEVSVVQQIFGSGFPKSTSIEKQIDRELGKSAEREVVGDYQYANRKGGKVINAYSADWGDRTQVKETSPATPEAAQWQGFGTALKPSTEFWWCVRKPLAESSIARNVLQWGTGGLNIDSTRVGSDTSRGDRYHGHPSLGGGSSIHQGRNTHVWDVPQGRFPSHLLLSHSPLCQRVGTKKVRGTAPRGEPSRGTPKQTNVTWTNGVNYNVNYADEHGLEEVQAFDCVPGCPVRQIDIQGGLRRRGEKKASHHDGHNGLFSLPSGLPHAAEEGFVSRYFTTFHDPVEHLNPSADPSSLGSSDDASPLSEPLCLLDQLSCVTQHLSQHNMNGSIHVHSVFASSRSVDRQLGDLAGGDLREYANALGVSQVVGSLFDCPSCLRFCGEHLHRIVTAFQDGAPSLHDALVDVHSFLSAHVHSQRHQESVLCSLDGSYQSEHSLHTAENNTHAPLVAHSERELQTPLHRQDILFEPSHLAGKHENTQSNKSDANDMHGKCYDNTHISGLVRLLTALAFDLSLRLLFDKSIPQNSIDSNTSEKNQPVEWSCHPSCPVRVLGEQSGESKSGAVSGEQGYKQYNTGVYGSNRPGSKIPREASEGTAARYFQQFHDPLDTLEAPFHYFSKSSRAERNRGLPLKMKDALIPECREGLAKKFTATMNDGIGMREHNADEPNAWNGNHHPTVKSISLMRWLCRLITPPGGIVLDPFLGSGSTAVAALQEGFHFIGIEAEEEYVTIARARIAYAQQEARKHEVSEGQEWDCHPSCVVAQLDAQSGIRKSGARKGPCEHTSDTEWGKGTIQLGGACEASEGGASRFFTQLSPDPIDSTSPPRTRGPKSRPSPLPSRSLWDTEQEEHSA